MKLKHIPAIIAFSIASIVIASEANYQLALKDACKNADGTDLELCNKMNQYGFNLSDCCEEITNMDKTKALFSHLLNFVGL